MNAFGLSEEILADLHRLIMRFPEVKEVLVYGSRADGTYAPASDIDLAIVSNNISPERYTALWAELDGLSLVYKLDILHWDTLDSQMLKDRIKQTGKQLYPSVSEPAWQEVLTKRSFGELRSMLHDRFHDHLDTRFKGYIQQDPQRYGAYYTAMYLLQDCYESTSEIAANGFSRNPRRGYIEVWGYLQAIMIAQDSLCELYQSVCDTSLDTAEYTYWKEARTYRHEIAGHPILQNHQFRSFFGRHHHNVEEFTYERLDRQLIKANSSCWDAIEHRSVNLRELRDNFFEIDGTDALRKVLNHIDNHIRSAAPSDP